MKSTYLVSLSGADVLNGYTILGVIDDLSDLKKVREYLYACGKAEYSEKSTSKLENLNIFEFPIINSDKDITLEVSEIKKF